MDSILTSVKMSIGGIDEGYTDFDEPIIQLINSQFSTLCQLGVGPVDGFRITGKKEEWSDFITDNRLNFVKDWMCLKVKVLFDPPQSSIVMEAYNQALSEFEWRINVATEQLNDG